MTQIYFIGLTLLMVLLALSYTQAAPIAALEKRHDTDKGFLPCAIISGVDGIERGLHIHLNPTEQDPSQPDPSQQGAAQ